MTLRELEWRLRTLLETRIVGALPGQRPEDLLVQGVLEAMTAGARDRVGGPRLAPTVFTLLVHPASLNAWKQPELQSILIDVVNAAAADRGLQFESPPTFTFAEDAHLMPGDVTVVASHRAENLPETQEMGTDSGAAAESEDIPSIPENAFLIVDGVKEFPLKQSVVNVGRRLDNNLVLDDPRVSRHHAQLRAIKGRFVLFDLNSSGGTFINGQRASQSILYPGDVISLAGVSLIFGQDSPLPQRDPSATAPRSRPGGERPTAIIRPRVPGLRKRP